MRNNDDDLTPPELVDRLAGGERWQLVDVREAWERDIASIEWATAIPMSEVHARVDELDRRRPVAVLCHSGIRSAVVAAWLRELDFDSVANVTGGIDAWSTSVDPSIPRY